MPDRDFATKAVGRVWAPACRLYVFDGVTEAAVDETAAALARILREESSPRERRYTPTTDLEAATRQEVERLEDLVSASLLAPSRRLLLENGRDFGQIDAQQRAMLAGLQRDIEHLARQTASGATPRRASRHRPSLRSVLSRAIRVQLGR